MNAEHQLVLTGVWLSTKRPGSRSRRGLTVRCRCMVGYARTSPRYYDYDWLARVQTLEQALAVYRLHVATGQTRVLENQVG